MEKYLFKANIFAKLSEIVEADSEKEVMECKQFMDKVEENLWAIEECGKGIIIKLGDLPWFPLWKVEPLTAITECLGFSIEDVYKAYLDKNKINYQRLKEGY